jgi:hypothetical protein
MAVFKPELHRIEDVIDYYENSPATHYKIYAGTSPNLQYCRFSFENDEKQIGLEELQKGLMAIQQNSENTNPYLLQLIQKKKNPKSKENDNLTSIVFQLNKQERYLPMMAGMQQQQSDPNLSRLLEKMMENQNLIISKLSAEEFEEEQEKPNALGAILNNPQVINNLMSYAFEIMDRIIPPKNNAANLSALAGIPDEQREKALQAIEILSTKDEQFGDHLLYLANIDQSTYKMLLGFMK